MVLPDPEKAGQPLAELEPQRCSTRVERLWFQSSSSPESWQWPTGTSALGACGVHPSEGVQSRGRWGMDLTEQTNGLPDLQLVGPLEEPGIPPMG